ncbi:M12 family metallopeptidase [Leptospira sp. 201903071]|uniref:M12 family metallopeptidase n=1 Tax=Leptospira ainazelensis TaxID=2810034 RepID=UPI00196657F5|nr:M12 family metallopeptidase [Leptospira ainazelensis]MBM9498754.1 M12 family metallopeptidase [Leptospira ainazelensis]
MKREQFPLADSNSISKYGSFQTPTGTINTEYSQLNSGEFIVGGDMVFKNKIDPSSDRGVPRTFAVSSPFAGLWTNKTVPYTLHPSLKETTRITRAIDYYTTHTEIRFIPRTIEVDYVNFQDNQSGCNSNIGKIGGRQDINIGNECGVSAVVHEMGHSLGLLHEHQRPDRDSFISIVWLNISPSASGAFARFEKPVGIEITAQNYDLCSIMHYSSYSTLNLTILAPLIITKDEKTIPYPTGFSATDILTIHDLYNGI